jgi:hypothetical protein
VPAEAQAFAAGVAAVKYPAPTAVSDSASCRPQPQQFRVEHSRVAVRERPATSSAALASKTKGTIVRAKGATDGWVELYDEPGYMLIDGTSVGLGELLARVHEPEEAAPGRAHDDEPRLLALDEAQAVASAWRPLTDDDFATAAPQMSTTPEVVSADVTDASAAPFRVVARAASTDTKSANTTSANTMAMPTSMPTSTAASYARVDAVKQRILAELCGGSTELKAALQAAMQCVVDLRARGPRLARTPSPA